MSTRRNLLTMMALAPVGAVAADNVTNRKDLGPPYKNGKQLQVNKYSPERLATALERLASEIRKQDVMVNTFNINTDVVGGETNWLTQTLTIGLEFLVEPEQSS